jgi:hypothetical protein
MAGDDGGQVVGAHAVQVQVLLYGGRLDRAAAGQLELQLGDATGPAGALASSAGVALSAATRGSVSLRSGSGSKITDKSAEVCDGRVEAG